MRIEDKQFPQSCMMKLLPYDESHYPLVDLQKGQLTFFPLSWIKVVDGKYPFVE